MPGKLPFFRNCSAIFALYLRLLRNAFRSLSGDWGVSRLPPILSIANQDGSPLLGCPGNFLI